MSAALLLVWQLTKAIAKTIGVKGYIILALVVALGAQHSYYEGLPLIRSIPFVGRLPWLGDVAIGKVQTRVNAAVDGARHAFAVEMEASVAKAKADAEAKSKQAAAIVADEYAKRLAASLAASTQKDKELDDALAANEKLLGCGASTGVKCPGPGASTVDLLRKHGFEVDQ
ncbi:MULTISPECIES: hypothetical protein [unclassified Rhizobium]